MTLEDLDNDGATGAAREPPDRQHVRVLHVDDDERFLSLSGEMLGEVAPEVEVVTATDAEAGLALLDERSIDCVVSDYSMDGTDGIEFLSTVRERDPDLPFILFTGHGSEEVASDAISAGVTDYLQKGTGDEYRLLANRIESAVEAYRAKHSATRYRDLLESAVDAVDDPFYLVDPDGELALWNEATTAVTGYDDLGGRRPEELFVPEDRPRIRTALEEALTEGRTVVEATLETADGEGVPFELSGSRLVDADGDLLGVAGFGRDLRYRARIKGDLAEVLGRVTDAFIAVDEDWTVVYCNESARELLGYADDDTLQGKGLWEEFPEAVGSTFYEHYHEARATGDPVEFEAHYEPLDTHFLVNAYPSETGLSVYFRDVSERRETQAELERRASTLRAMYRAVSRPDAEFDERLSALLSAGREALDTDYAFLTRIDGDELEFVVVDGDHDRLQDGLRMSLSETYCERAIATDATLATGDVVETDPRLAARDGYEDLGLSCYLGTPVVADGQIQGTLCFADGDARPGFDEWERTLVELMGNWTSHELDRERSRERLTAERDRLEEFASVLSHDLRSPLEAANGHVELLAAEQGDSERLDELRATLDRMAELVDDVLTLARSQEQLGATETVDLAETVRAAWAASGDPGDLVVVDDLGRVEADRSRLCQLFENLFRNAADHAGPDPTVRVGRLDGGFYVADDGPGIPADERETVFESGHSTDPAGTGLGLAIVDRVASAHGWSVTVAEGEAGGARFEFRPD
jgi:PAS domain S-box-containing protein